LGGSVEPAGLWKSSGFNRALAFQAVGCEFDSHLPLYKILRHVNLDALAGLFDKLRSVVTSALQ
jgi:hypothetical protein